jgi:hypothetical protein
VVKLNIIVLLPFWTQSLDEPLTRDHRGISSTSRPGEYPHGQRVADLRIASVFTQWASVCAFQPQLPGGPHQLVQVLAYKPRTQSEAFSYLDREALIKVGEYAKIQERAGRKRVAVIQK